MITANIAVIHDTGILSLDVDIEVFRSMDFIIPYNRVLRSVNFIDYRVSKQRPDTMSRDRVLRDGCPGLFMWFWQQPYMGKEHHICLKTQRVEALFSVLT